MELPEHLSIQQLPELLKNKITLTPKDYEKVRANRKFLDKKIASGHTFYGINTGFGSLCNVRIEVDELQSLQENLVRSHACGMGDEVPQEIVKLMMLLKIRGLAQGYSGIHEDTINRLVYFYNEDIIPVVYEQGSLGASGDLAPLAHLSLPLIGEGLVCFNGEKRAMADVLRELNLKPVTLHAKEGLALLNGTQFMSAYACYALIKARNLEKYADKIAALSLEAFDGLKEPFLPYIHQVRPHKGQVETASSILNYLQESKSQEKVKEQVQDPYSFRCVPQVHGATKDTLQFAEDIITTEINAVTDNPTVFEKEDLIVSGGNFHGQPLALQMDFMAIALAELANISERRIYLLVSGQRGLPAFLANKPGVNSGFMIVQYTAASIVSQNKQLCHPASVDSITSSNGQEDHVSMGANAATKLKKVLDNVQRVLAIELLCAAQAMDFRKPEETSETLFLFYKNFRKVVAFNDKDRFMHPDLVAAEMFLNMEMK